MLTIIIPTYQAADELARLLPQLSDFPVIVADCGSTDETLSIAAKYQARMACGAQGRGNQLRLGGQLALMAGEESDWFLFLHADSQMCEGWQEAVRDAMREDQPRYFRFKADAIGLLAGIMNTMVGLRCWALGLPYGDQGLLISRRLYESIGGYSDMPLFEDVDIVSRLKRVTRLKPLSKSLITDVSRYKQDGLWTRGLSNLRLLWRYKRGVDVETLRRDYTA